MMQRVMGVAVSIQWQRKCSDVEVRLIWIERLKSLFASVR